MKLELLRLSSGHAEWKCCQPVDAKTQADASQQLPVELLGNILLTILPPYNYEQTDTSCLDAIYSARQNIRLVCKRWSDIVEQDPRFWTVVELSDRVPTENLRKVLEQTRGALLDVNIRCGDDSFRLKSFLRNLHLLPRESRRWESLSIHGSKLEPRELAALIPRYLPALKKVVFGDIMGPRHSYKHLKERCSAPNLTAIVNGNRGRNQTLNSYLPFMFKDCPNITNIRMVGYSSMDTPQPLGGGTFSTWFFESLKSLEVRGYFPIHNLPPMYTLPNLKYLHLMGSSDEGLLRFLQQFHAPNLEILRISFIRSTGTEAEDDTKGLSVIHFPSSMKIQFHETPESVGRRVNPRGFWSASMTWEKEPGLAVKRLDNKPQSPPLWFDTWSEKDSFDKEQTR
ncbi:hypothetical protein FRB99_005450 [Tulasnella sp. 403]|nr:hypothetical protein FRB99_005450 [Tulasnella sp. 403]